MKNYDGIANTYKIGTLFTWFLCILMWQKGDKLQVYEGVLPSPANQLNKPCISSSTGIKSDQRAGL